MSTCFSAYRLSLLLALWHLPIWCKLGTLRLHLGLNMLLYVCLSFLCSHHSRFHRPILTLRIKIPIDHNDSSVGTYQNQYFVNEKYYSPGGPILLFDVGESVAAQRADQLLYNSTSFLGDFLKEFHAMGIVWEHRYFTSCRQIYPFFLSFFFFFFFFFLLQLT